MTAGLGLQSGFHLEQASEPRPRPQRESRSVATALNSARYQNAPSSTPSTSAMTPVSEGYKVELDRAYH